MKYYRILGLFVLVFIIQGSKMSWAFDDIMAGSSSQSVNDASLSTSQSSDATVISSQGITSASEGINRGIIINSNPDGMGATEHFQVYDSGDQVFSATGGTSTFMQSGTSNVTVNNNGTVTIATTSGASVSGGVFTDNSGISSSGTITGGTITDGTASLTSGALSGVTTISSSGNATIATGASTTNTFGIGTGSSTTLGATGAGTTSLVGGTSSVTLNTAGGVAIAGNTGVTGTESVSSNFSANGATNHIGTTQASTNTIGTFAASTTTIGNTTGVTGITGSAVNINTSNTSGLTTTIGSTNATAGNVTLQANTNSVVVNSSTTQSATIAGNTFDYGTTVNGGMLVNGSLGVNGNIYTLNPTANASVNVGNNGLSITGSSNVVVLTSEGASPSNGVAQLTMTPTTGSLLVANTTTGVQEGLNIGQGQTVLSGGTHSTSLTLNDNGATFNNDLTNGPAQVHGVADGTAPNDAVNVEQLQGASDRSFAGVASAMAMANIPSPAPGKNYAIGAAYGNYSDEDAVAIGVKALVAKDVTLSVDYAYADQVSSVGAGVSYSF